MKSFLCLLITVLTLQVTSVEAQNGPKNFQNPVLPGFSPDPSICRVGEDYYLVTSSFLWYPGIPIYHSKDLVNWELIGHGITRPGELNLQGVKDKDGIWAVTIRHHQDLFYLITNCSNCGGNFYITAKDPRGSWSDPVWIRDAPGIDPSLMWDDDDKCYYSGNFWDFKKSWPGQVAVWTQQLDTKEQKLTGERKILTYGYANNAGYAESPHLYKIDGKYLLMMAEGGTDRYHAITVHHGNSILGPYTSDKINPVLSHRQFGKDYPIQGVGHGDLVQTQNGEWWAVVLGRRLVEGEAALSRETFLCRVQFEEGTPIFNPGYGRVLPEQPRPNLPWTPVPADPIRDDFDGDSLDLKWHCVRAPKQPFFQLGNGVLTLYLKPETVDSLICAPMLIRKIGHFQFEAATKLTFKTSSLNEEAGLIIHRTNNSYYTLMKGRSEIILTKKFEGRKETIARVPYQDATVYLKVTGDNLKVQFSFGASADKLLPIGKVQSLNVIAESSTNRFNGPGVGVYGSSNGRPGKNKAQFDWFDYRSKE